MKNKKIKITFLCILVILLAASIIFILLNYNKSDETAKLKDKINSQMKYLDYEIVAMINSLNNIQEESYKIMTEELDNQKSGEESEQKNQSSQSSSGGSDSSGGSSNSGFSGSSSTKSYKNYTMVPQNLLNRDESINWDNLQNSITTLYTTWTTIMLDLYKVNVKSEDILSFNTDLDKVIDSIKNKNKLDSIKSLAKLYSYIPIYVNEYSEDTTYKNITSTKSYIINSYAAVEEDKWEDVKIELKKAEGQYTNILNNISSNKYKEYTINKTYVLLKESETSADKKDKDIYYIKYKSLIGELNNI